MIGYGSRNNPLGGIGIGGVISQQGNDDDENLSDDEIEFDHIFMKEFREKRIQGENYPPHLS